MEICSIGNLLDKRQRKSFATTSLKQYQLFPQASAARLAVCSNLARPLSHGKLVQRCYCASRAKDATDLAGQEQMWLAPPDSKTGVQVDAGNTSAFGYRLRHVEHPRGRNWPQKRRRRARIWKLLAQIIANEEIGTVAVDGPYYTPAAVKPPSSTSGPH